MCGDRGLPVLVATMFFLVCGCDQTADDRGSSENPAGTTLPSTSTEETPRHGYEIPIPRIEYWESTTTPKYFYEMRFDPPLNSSGRPRLHRNGWARAYYADGSIEREGAYRFDASLNRSERVGEWTYYQRDGSVARVEQRGGPAIWTGPDQRIPPPERPEP